MQQFSYIAAVFVLGGIASAAIIAIDQRSCRQPMPIMRSVWILTGLWASFFGLWAYYAFGRPRRCTLDERGVHDFGSGNRNDFGSGDAGSATERTTATEPMHGTRSRGMEMSAVRMQEARSVDSISGTEQASGPRPGGMEMSRMPGKGVTEGIEGTDGMRGMRDTETMPATGGMTDDMKGMSGMAGMDMPPRPRWQSVVLSTLHCGAGCTLADLIGEWFLFFVPVAIGGSLIAGSWVLDYILALIFGIGFQYAAIRGMEPATPRSQIVRRAAKADILSLTAWQAGMYGWMAVVIFALRDGTPLPRTSFAFWFMMQVAMAFGFLLALPVNVLLIRAGIKKGM